MFRFSDKLCSSVRNRIRIETIYNGLSKVTSRTTMMMHVKTLSGYDFRNK